jgi:hypothetical protein
LPAASTVTTWFTPETLTMLKRLVNSPMTSTRTCSVADIHFQFSVTEIA